MMSAKFAGNFFVSLLGTWEVSVPSGFLIVCIVYDYLGFEKYIYLSWLEVWWQATELLASHVDALRAI